MNGIELKPCPFCGENVKIYYSHYTGAFFAKHNDSSKSTCVLRLPIVLAKKLQEAIEKWNRRVNDNV